MRWTILGCRATTAALLVAWVAACGGPEGRSDIAAEAGGATLQPAELGAWVARVPGREPTSRDAEFVAVIWTDYTLLAQALERGDSLTDSATIAAALVPDLGLQTLRAWRDTLARRRPRVAAARIDSIYVRDTVRVFQHVLLRVQDPRDARELGVVRASADSLLAVARDAATDFSALAVARSQDSLTAGNGGWLPTGPRGLMPPEFERAAWGLPPGGVGGVASRLGFHIVRRPPLDQVRDRLTQYAESLATRQADARHLDSLTTASGLSVTKDAIPALRAFFEDPGTRTPGTVALATWAADGVLQLGDVARWIDLLPPRGYLDLRGASDLALEAFVKELGQQSLMLEQARAAGITVTPDQRVILDSAYRRNLAAVIGILGASDTVPLQAGEGSRRVAALLEGLTSDQVQWRPLPGALGALLRERAGYRLHAAGIAAAVEAARAARLATQP